MFNRRDTSPTYDYEELQRRHAEFKERKRQQMAQAAVSAEAPSVQNKTPAPVVPAEEAPVQPETVVEPEIIPDEDLSFADADIPQEIPIDLDEDAPAQEPAFSEAPYDEDEIAFDEQESYPEDEYYEDEYVDDGADGEDGPRQNPNPFDSFFSVFSKIKGKFSRKKAGGEEEYYDYEDEFSDENLPPEDDYAADPAQAPSEEYAAADSTGAIPEEDSYAEEAPISRRSRFARHRASAPADESEIYAGEDIAEDIAEDVASTEEYAPAYAEDDDAYNDSYEGDYGDDYQEDDYSDADDDFESNPRRHKKIGKFGKFIRLFVVPVDEDEPYRSDDEWDQSNDDYDDEDYSEPYNSEYEAPADYVEHDAFEENTATGLTHQDNRPVEDTIIEGGLDNMADLNRINPELSRTLAADLENPGMSRRERRKLAAEEAARKAEEEKMFADLDIEDAAPAKEEPETISELFVEEPLEADTVEDVASGIVKIEEVSEPSIDVSVVDEPTREFKPVSKMSFDEFMSNVEAEEKKAPEANEEADAEDEEDEEVEEKPRKGLFGRRKSKKVVEDDEYDDEDDYDDEDEYDDEEDEEVEEKPRRGLFGRRKAKKVVEEDEYDDEDEDYEEDEEEEEVPAKRSRKNRRQDRYDDEDDYDDEDEYDDEDYDDEYEDDYDEYEDDDDDYDEGGSSFGRSILRFFIVIISLVLIFAIVLLGANILNVVDVISLTPLAERMPEKVADILLFSEETKQLLAAGDDEAADAANAQDDSGMVNEIVIPEITLEDTKPETPVNEVEAEPSQAPIVPVTTDAAPATVG